MSTQHCELPRTETMKGILGCDSGMVSDIISGAINDDV